MVERVAMRRRGFLLGVAVIDGGSVNGFVQTSRRAGLGINERT